MVSGLVIRHGFPSSQARLKAIAGRETESRAAVVGGHLGWKRPPTS
jgi:hypothetical protein